MKNEINLSQHQAKLISTIAAHQRLSINEWITQSLEEAIEDAIDIQIATQALADYEKDPKRYSLQEVLSILKSSSQEPSK
jgi:hypothetical protein